MKSGAASTSTRPGSGGRPAGPLLAALTHAVPRCASAGPTKSGIVFFIAALRTLTRHCTDERAYRNRHGAHRLGSCSSPFWETV